MKRPPWVRLVASIPPKSPTTPLIQTSALPPVCPFWVAGLVRPACLPPAAGASSIARYRLESRAATRLHLPSVAAPPSVAERRLTASWLPRCPRIRPELATSAPLKMRLSVLRRAHLPTPVSRRLRRFSSDNSVWRSTWGRVQAREQRTQVRCSFYCFLSFFFLQSGCTASLRT